MVKLNSVPDNLSLDLLTSALKSSHAGILITDNSAADNPIIYCNPAFEKITGYSSEEIIGLNSNFLHGHHIGILRKKEIKEAIAKGNDLTVVIPSYKKDGTMFLNEIKFSAIRNEANVVTHFVGIMQDVTDRSEPATKNKYDLSGKNIESRRLKIPKRSIKKLQALVQSLKFLLPYIKDNRV